VPAPEAPTSLVKVRRLPGEDCPCCKRGGWMRDLPPQADAIALEAPVRAYLALPLLALPHAPMLVPETRGPARLSTAPPGESSPSGCPVGIVRLQI